MGISTMLTMFRSTQMKHDRTSGCRSFLDSYITTAGERDAGLVGLSAAGKLAMAATGRIWLA
jgi:hypothetical protein